jgi:hypothetical protein
VAAGQFAVILGDRVLIAGGDFGRVGVADGASAIFVELTAQLEFQGVYAADELLVHLLYQRGVPRETAGIQISHLIDQCLQLLTALGAILYRGANLVQKTQSLIDFALGVGRVETLLGRDRTPRDAGIAGVISAQGAASATGRVAYRTGYAVSDSTRLAGAALPRLLLARLA